MKKLASILLIFTVLLSMAGCANTQETKQPEQSEQMAETKEQPPEDVDISWYAENGSAICSGLYVVGEDIKPGNYIFTAYESFGAITIFESMDDYIAYHQTRKASNLEENSAHTNHSIVTDILFENETYSSRLDEGNVLFLEDFKGTAMLSDGSSSEEAPITESGKVVSSGLYRSGDIQKGTYILSNGKDTEMMRVLVFEDAEAYKKFKNADKTYAEDYVVAIEQFVLYDAYLYGGESCYLNMTEESVIMLDGGTIYLEVVDMNWAN